MMMFALNDTAFPFKNYLELPPVSGGYTHKISTIIFKKKSPVFIFRG